MDAAARIPRQVRRIGRGALVRDFFWSTAGRRASRRLRRKGYPVLAAVPSEAVGRELFYNGLYEEDLLLALFDEILVGHRAAFSDGIALDVGANVGNHALFFARRFREVVAFEPNPPIGLIFEANVALNAAHNVRLAKVGLSDEERELTFATGNATNLGAGRFSATAALDNERLVTLPVRRGDRELERLGVAGPVRLIKLDVEGHELRALRGLQEVLERDAPLVLFESNVTGGPGGGAETAAWLAQQGYTHLYSIGPEWVIPRPLLQRLIKVAGLLQLAFGLFRGGSYWIRPVARLEERIYPLLLASRQPL